MRQLADVVLELGRGRSGGRLYVAPPWTPNSRALVHDLTSAIDPPTGLEPLIDADLAFEYVRAWSIHQPVPPTPVAVADALLRFARGHASPAVDAPPPRLRVTTSSGHSYDDPTEDLVYQLMLQVDAGEEKSFIIGRMSDPTEQTFVRVGRNADRTFIVEQRDGSAATHRSREVAKMATAYSILLDWAFHELDAVPPRSPGKPTR